MDDILTKCTVTSNIIEEEIEIDVKYIKEIEGMKMIVESWEPILIVSNSLQLRNYDSSLHQSFQLCCYLMIQTLHQQQFLLEMGDSAL